MVYNVFLDTNILVDFFLDDRSGHADAVALIDAADKQLLNICFSESVINTTVYLTRKTIYVDMFKKAMLELNSFIKVLLCTNSIVEDAYFNAKNDLEDSVLYQIALAGKVDYFITSNIKDFKKLEKHSLPVLTAAELIKII
ncbi:MAG: type II toxin-antitoxin system VapC family toxin [Chitinophagaceae bacterium]